MINWLKKIFTCEKRIAEFAEVKRHTVDIDTLMRTAFRLHQNGELLQATALYEKILDIVPNHEDSLYLLGLIKFAEGNNEAAKSYIEKALNINGQEPAFHKSLGDIYNQQLLKQEACNHYEIAKILDSSDIELFFILGSIYEQLGQLKKAEENLTSFIKFRSNSWQALSLLGDILLQLGHIEQAVEMLRKCHELVHNNPVHFSSYLFSLNFHPELSAGYIFSEHQKYQSLFKEKVKRKYINSYEQDKKLRIGYISPDFRAHPVSRFIIPVLEHHNYAEFEIYCYYNHPQSDMVTEHIKSLPLNFRSCSKETKEDLCLTIQTDGIDILVDLAGHTSYNNLPVMRLKPSPIQVTWLGYINTTGLDNIDYRIVDPYSDPFGTSEKFHSEALLRLPNCQWCYQKPDQLIDVSTLPALESGNICFGSLNRFTKLSTKILNLWAILLTEIPESRLIIVGAPYDRHTYLIKFFDTFNISNERIELYTAVGLDEFRALHHKIDIALDSHPYSGATTTCDSAWMGVPTLTLVGETSISRSTSSILINLGLDDWIARTELEFITVAKKQVDNLENLSNLRANLRNKLESSPIMDSAQFTIDLEKAYREIWIKKCNEIDN